MSTCLTGMLQFLWGLFNTKLCLFQAKHLLPLCFLTMVTLVYAFLPQFHQRQFGITVLTLEIFFDIDNIVHLRGSLDKLLTTYCSVILNCLFRDSLAKADAKCEKHHSSCGTTPMLPFFVSLFPLYLFP